MDIVEIQEETRICKEDRTIVLESGDRIQVLSEANAITVDQVPYEVDSVESFQLMLGAVANSSRPITVHFMCMLNKTAPLMSTKFNSSQMSLIQRYGVSFASRESVANLVFSDIQKIVTSPYGKLDIDCKGGVKLMMTFLS